MRLIYSNNIRQMKVLKKTYLHEQYYTDDVISAQHKKHESPHRTDRGSIDGAGCHVRDHSGYYFKSTNCTEYGSWKHEDNICSCSVSNLYIYFLMVLYIGTYTF